MEKLTKEQLEALNNVDFKELKKLFEEMLNLRKQYKIFKVKYILMFILSVGVILTLTVLAAGYFKEKKYLMTVFNFLFIAIDLYAANRYVFKIKELTNDIRKTEVNLDNMTTLLMLQDILSEGDK